jgi:hypothetical protein
MIPMFKAKEEEAQQQYEKLQSVKTQLDKFKGELGICSERRQIQPLATTSFMNRTKVSTASESRRPDLYSSAVSYRKQPVTTAQTRDLIL